ncbi:response regulator [Pollutibacter soli]|uniref:response regulator n=1 Tax=Pollutibacter soli TaxID=3034157 RepID=UPI0030134E15
MNKGITIFYVDDDQDDLDYLSIVINDINKGVELFTHNSANDLMHALHNPPPKPHVVFVDLNMPGTNGFELVEDLRKSEQHKDLPIVVFSTATDPESIRKSKNLGANFYLPKSGDYSALRKSIEYVLDIDWQNFIPGNENFIYRYN